VCGKLIYSLSLLLSLSIAAHRANASYPFLQDPGPDGIVSMEAENYDNTTKAPDGHFWKLVWPAGASDSNAMQAWPNAGINRSSDYITLSPHLDLKVSFVKTGTHYIWIRGYASTGSDDSCHAGLNKQPDPNGERIKFDKIAEWGWFNARENNAGRATLDVTSTSVHTVNIWMRKDGAIIDKIVLTTNSTYTPKDAGPEESTRANPLFVDDFEDYNDTNRIFKTWIDGNNPGNGTGATIGHPNPPYVEQAVAYVYGGKKSMPYYYNNNKTGKAYYSEAEADTANLEIDPNWTREGIKALALHFHGDPTNDANATEQMYVALKDDANKMTVVDYDGDANDIQKTSWQEWNIDLKEFTNVNLVSVKKVYIGFGNRNHPTSGGSGLVYFDDIRLYPSRCVPSRVKGNFNDDCVVDYADLKVMTDSWLNDYQFEDFASLADSWLEEVLWPQ